MSKLPINVTRCVRRTVAGLIVASALPAFAVTVMNGSMTGTPAFNSVPDGWSATSQTPDINDLNTAAGGISGAEFAVAASDSPDGGTWVGLGADDSFSERISQPLDGFLIGTQYTVTWYAANFGLIGDFSEDYINGGRIRVWVGNSPIGLTDLIPLQTGWTLQSMTFTASATTQQISFGTTQGLPAYLAIDGITITAIDTDTDGDGVSDAQDNCTLVSNALQRDTNDDGFGNACDPDLNDDGIVNAVDLGRLRVAFFGTPDSGNWDADADFNGDDVVNTIDLGILRSFFFLSPGPAGANE